MYCPTCGKELYGNGEERFNCPFCGAEVVGSGPETEEEREETLEERCKRLERELARQKLKAEIEEQSAAEHFWFSGGNPFSMLFRQSARNALERGDIESAKRHLASAEKSLNVGCLLFIVAFVVILTSLRICKVNTSDDRIEVGARQTCFETLPLAEIIEEEVRRERVVRQ